MPNGPNLTLERSLRPARIVMKRHTNILLQSPGISNNNPLRALLVGNPEGRALYNTYSHGVFMHVHVHVDVRVHVDVICCPLITTQAHYRRGAFSHARSFTVGDR